MTTYKLVVLHGTRRIGNKSIHVARFLHQELAACENADVKLLSLMDYDFPLMEVRRPLVWPAGMQEVFDLLSEAHGILIVAPEYKNGIPAALKNLLDFLPTRHFRHKAVALSAVSSLETGGLDCIAQLRIVMGTLGGITVPERLQVTLVEDLFNEAGEPNTIEYLKESSKTFLEEFLWLTIALASAK